MKKNEGKLNLGEQLSRSELKNVIGGVAFNECDRDGSEGFGAYRRCSASMPNCAGPQQTPITPGYCAAVWPASMGVVVCC